MCPSNYELYFYKYSAEELVNGNPSGITNSKNDTHKNPLLSLTHAG